MDKRAWWATVYRIAELDMTEATWLTNMFLKKKRNTGADTGNGGGGHFMRGLEDQLGAILNAILKALMIIITWSACYKYRKAGTSLRNPEP